MILNSIASTIGSLICGVYSNDKDGSPKDSGSAKDAFDWLSELGEGIADLFSESSSTTGCDSHFQERSGSQNSGVHFYVTGDGRDSWGAAADQVLRWFCGIAEPTDEQVTAAGRALREANENHLEQDVFGVISYDSDTPRGVDHRLGLFWRSNTEIFIPLPTPATICPAIEIPLVTPVAPDSGSDAGGPDVGAADTADVGDDGTATPDISGDQAEEVEGQGEVEADDGADESGEQPATQPQNTSGSGHRPRPTPAPEPEPTPQPGNTPNIVIPM
ncbi:MAG: hypothetical protein JW782_04820 [Candidatus Saganbacteria bacterium]|nr:hypothetical protein [Candidatus Saganbacteria bacterium]